jgi:hypothetical protein
MSILPPERHSILLVDPNAVPTGLIALQPFETIPRRNDEIVEPAGGIEQFQFTLYDAPQLARDSSSCARVSLAKQADVSSAND